jgi:hypothetical protein
MFEEADAKCSIELPNVQESDPTDDDSSTNVDLKNFS